MAAITRPTTKANDVLLYIPNLIGYGRIFLALTSFALMILQPTFVWLSTFLYLASFVGDLIDGHVARKYQQTSNFGGVLDMVTDRCATMGLLYILGLEFQRSPIGLGFVLLQILDISSHWCQMHSSLSLGEHHKSEQGNADKNVLVQWFYRYYYFFGYLCVGTEFTYLILYVRQRLIQQGGGDHWLLPIGNYALIVTAPACLAKQVVNIAQLMSACHSIANHDAQLKNKQRRVLSSRNY